VHCLQLGSSAADADQAFQRFLPFLVDLDGWQGKKPEGFSMETSGTNMITLAATKTGMNLETSEMRMNTSTIDGR
jgi:hypothetical protein